MFGVGLIKFCRNTAYSRNVDIIRRIASTLDLELVVRVERWLFFKFVKKTTTSWRCLVAIDLRGIRVKRSVNVRRASPPLITSKEEPLFEVLAKVGVHRAWWKCRALAWFSCTPCWYKLACPKILNYRSSDVVIIVSLGWLCSMQLLYVPQYGSPQWADRREY